MSVIIRARDITKTFGREIKAVDGLSFTVEEGQVYGFLGQNGAGKSTTIRMLLTLITPGSGDIEIFGMNLPRNRKAILRRTGAIIERPDLYKYLTALENLRIFARMSGLNLTDKVLMEHLAKIGLADRAHSKVKTYSQGMKQRLGIATALVHDPQLIILDEPTNGLDPQGIADVRNLILHLSREEGKTIFVSSHLLHEIELVADAMLIIDKGKKIIEGKVEDLLHPADTLVVIQTQDDAKTRQLLQESSWQPWLKPGEEIVLSIHRDEIPALARYLIQEGVQLISIQTKHSLENYFLSLTSANQHVAAYTN